MSGHRFALIALLLTILIPGTLYGQSSKLPKDLAGYQTLHNDAAEFPAVFAQLDFADNYSFGGHSVKTLRPIVNGEWWTAIDQISRESTSNYQNNLMYTAGGIVQLTEIGSSGLGWRNIKGDFDFPHRAGARWHGTIIRGVENASHHKYEYNYNFKVEGSIDNFPLLPGLKGPFWIITGEADQGYFVVWSEALGWPVAVHDGKNWDAAFGARLGNRNFGLTTKVILALSEDERKAVTSQLDYLTHDQTLYEHKVIKSDLYNEVKILPLVRCLIDNEWKSAPSASSVFKIVSNNSIELWNRIYSFDSVENNSGTEYISISGALLKTAKFSYGANSIFGTRVAAISDSGPFSIQLSSDGRRLDAENVVGGTGSKYSLFAGSSLDHDPVLQQQAAAIAIELQRVDRIIVNRIASENAANRARLRREEEAQRLHQAQQSQALVGALASAIAGVTGSPRGYTVSQNPSPDSQSSTWAQANRFNSTTGVSSVGQKTYQAVNNCVSYNGDTGYISNVCQVDISVSWCWLNPDSQSDAHLFTCPTWGGSGFLKSNGKSFVYHPKSGQIIFAACQSPGLPVDKQVNGNEAAWKCK